MWHKTRVGLLTFGIIELLLAYAVASWAIDSGNLLLYVLTFVLLAGGLHNGFKLINRSIHGNRH